MPAIPAAASGPGARVCLDATGKLPALDASQLTNLPGGGGAIPVLEDHFVTSNVTLNTIAKLGWRTTGNGTGNRINVTGVPGHPGVLSLNPGVATATGKRSLQLGQNATPGGFQLSTTGLQSPLEIDWLVRIRGGIGILDLEMIQLGIADANEDTTNGQLQNFLGVSFNPTVSNKFRACAANAGATSFQDGTTVVALNTWYRVGFVFTDTGSGGSLQLKVNGVNEGAPVTLNFPTIVLSLFAKIDGQGLLGNDPILDLDQVRVFQTITP